MKKLLIALGAAAVALVLFASCDGNKQGPEPEPLPPTPHQADSLALVDIYNVADGANWAAAKKWDLEKPINEWPGIAVNDEGRVVELVISNGTVTTTEWEIPESLQKLTELKKLQIIGSQLVGAIPDFIWDLSKLEDLRFNTNSKLTGNISKIAQLTNLVSFFMNGTAITGPIPASIGQLKKLETLNISKTGLNGSIPAEIAGCTALKNLCAYECAFTGQLPDIFDQFANLGVIQFYGNPGLEGPLPASFGRASTTGTNYSIQIHNCNFTGNIPESYGTLPAQCKMLFLYGNKLSGEIPAAVVNHPNWNKWNAAEKILPQQEGYELTLP